MPRCCPPPGVEIFTEKIARRDARRFRKRGLDPTGRRLVELAKHDGATVLEVGGGVGAVQIELLRAGALRTTNVELSPTYEAEAESLLAEAGLRDRVDRRVHDFAVDPAAVEDADVVVMHRVVCCYPDMPRLVGAAADKARVVLALSFPRETWWLRLGGGAINLWSRLARNEFRFFLHPAAGIAAAAESHGLRQVSDREGTVWRVVAFERAR